MTPSHASPVLEPGAAGGVTAEQLERIHRYTRRPFQPDDLFVFSVILCDNEIDRDHEQFPAASLDRLGQLYLGKTGVFDHTPKAEHQSARIFETRVEPGDGLNSLGEPYRVLKAWAYMVRCRRTTDLILEIDAGIKKEVSVGCSVERIVCSVCGADQKTDGCPHQKGQRYDDVRCHHLLLNPTDAYEWSFVAVPAQKRAGVTKRIAAEEGTVSIAKARLEQLEELAQAGTKYRTDLCKNVVRLGLLGHGNLSEPLLKGIADRLNLPQLEALEQSFAGAARKRYPLSAQLSPAPGTDGSRDPDGPFCI